MDFLGDGLELEATDITVDLPIHREADDGPMFTVKVRMLPVKEYRKVFSKVARQDGGFRSSNSAQDKVDQDYLKRVILGWSGLTIPNWNAIIRDGKKIGGEKAEELTKKGYEIPFSQEASFYLYRNTWPQKYGNQVFDAVQEGQKAIDEEDENLDNS